MTFKKYVAIILDIAVDKVLDYGVPTKLLDKVKRGMRVSVPVMGYQRKGYILEVKDYPSYPKVVPISAVIGEEEMITADLFELALWMAKYYCAPLRQVFKTLLPAAIRKDTKPKEQLFVSRLKSREELRELCIKRRPRHPSQAAVLDVMLQVTKGIFLSELLEKAQVSRSPIETLAKQGYLALDQVHVERSPLENAEYFMTKPKILTGEQQIALDQINKAITSHSYATHLLFGITGSGKTEIYLQAIDQALQLGRGTIMLIPEISLTPQTVERFKTRFKEKIAILHHRLSQGERFDEWHKIRHGEAKIVIGARSAVFCPVKNLGLIIVDEEHESSYKQEDEAPHYHARDIAVMRGKMTDSTVILGSATPSIESYYNAQQGKYILNTLQARPDEAVIPQVRIIDMRSEVQQAGRHTPFSADLLDGIQQRYAVGEQVVLFLNRRGYHTTQLCQACGHIIRCEHCDVALTFHRNHNSLSCHLCGYSIVPPPQCPKCHQSETLKYKGTGTEQIERSLHAIFPEIRTVRLDADTTKHKGSYQKLLRSFRNGKADVLIGTQMIAKGLHFPEVTLVGVLNSDAQLNIPDFRASENAFQLITQVAGRAGRGYTPGEVIIQTYMPDNATIKLASQQNYTEFYKSEIALRELFQFPPFSQMIKFTISGKDEKQTIAYAENLQKKIAKSLPPPFEVWPVTPAGHAKIKDKFRFLFFTKGPSVYTMNSIIEKNLKYLHPIKDIRITVNVSPINTYS
ncbi:MAG: primosomal protein N' [Chlamydiota bacterium]